MTIEFDMSEVEALAAELAAAGPKAEKVSSVDLTRIAGELRNDARASAPVDTGELRDSIRVRSGKDWRIVEATAEHASYVHFGTSDTSPQPYLWPHVGDATRALAIALGDITPFTR